MTTSAPGTAPSPDRLAAAIRVLAADAVEQAKSGHPGMPLGAADIATALFTRALKFDATAPRWPDRDRFVLSAGHGSMLLYAAAYLTGYPDLDLGQVRNFRQLESRTPGHPEVGHPLAAETTTGPLGQGLATAVGMAIAERMMAARFGDALVNHRTWVLVGDGCLMEGISHEAISLAGHLRLNKLAVLWDDNRITIDGSTEISVSDDQIQRFRASGWNTLAVDGHDADALERVLAAAQVSDRPTLIACRTTIGRGAPTKAGSEKTHGAPLGGPEIAKMKENLNWPQAPFAVPDDVLAAWRSAGRRGADTRLAWEQRLAALPAEKQAEFQRVLSGELNAGWEQAIESFKAAASAKAASVATRKASQDVLEVLTPALTEMVGGSADLTHSNLTITKALKGISAEDFSGRYIYYGIREFGMAAVMNGLALHGGAIPFGGTFLVFSDYMRNAIRLSALMGLRVAYVMTHDSIGVGEDGPTHQPIEHLTSLRAMPNLWVLRPADVVETAECWALAVSRTDGPALLALSRQNLPTLRTTHTSENLCRRGAYILAEADGTARVTLIGTGSEVSLALKTRDLLQAQGIGARVVSMPCWELFAAQDAAYRRQVIDPGTLRVSLEMGSTLGWERYTGENGVNIGIDQFGASAPPDILFRHYGFTPEAVAARVVAALG